MTAEMAIPSSETTRPQKVLLGSVTALAQSAWMGFALASDVLEQLRLAPSGILRRIQVIRPAIPRDISLKNLLTREYSVGEASFILMASFFLSAALGAVRQVLFNAQFGVSTEANAYYAAFRLPDTLFSLIAGGALSSAMIPVLLNARQKEGEESGWRLISVVLTSLLSVFALLILAVEIFTPALVTRVLAPGFDAETSGLTITLTRIMLIQPMILLLGSVATAVLNSRNQFLLTGLSIVSHNVSLIASILMLKLFPDLGIFGPTMGVIGGALLQALILSPGLRGEGYSVGLLFDLASTRLREVVRLLIPNGLSVSVNYAGFIVDTSFATRAVDPAGLAAIYNAFLLVGLPIALLGQAIGQATFPRLAAQAEAGNWIEMRRVLLRSLGTSIALALPALAALLLLGRPTIRILFEHGEFTSAAGDLTYQVLVAYAIGLPAYVATEVITRGLISLRDTRTPLFTNSGQLILRIALISILLSSMGVVAIPAAFAISATIETLTLATVLFLKLRSRSQSQQAATSIAMER
ncbi:MAG TPA: murein biosynthesis integral membrane protein MurJ [Anaerolineales bacterium]|nr:murein biosynthesis integral membrane protein MurJ [Anaerolineales bacterium]